jgi:hypothetical protein
MACLVELELKEMFQAMPGSEGSLTVRYRNLESPIM